MNFFKKLFVLIYFFSISAIAVEVVDDCNRKVTLTKPAERIISTAPYLTEFLYEVGAGEKIVGVTEYSDYPVQAKKHLRVGDYRFIDIEKVISLKPDLLVVWKSGNPIRQIKKLEEVGLSIFYSDIKNIEDIESTFKRLAILSGKESAGKKKASLWKEKLLKLQEKFKNENKLKVFYQVSERPLYTVSEKFIISEGIKLCGGQNIFSESSLIAPQVNIEEVIKRNPDVIFISDNTGNPSSVKFWNRFKLIEGVKKENLFVVDPDLIERPGPRFLDGLTILCEKLQTVRQQEKVISH